MCTGMATSGLAVLCDGADSCNVVLTNCTVTGNKLLWSPAVDPKTVNPNGATSIRNSIVEADYEGYQDAAGTTLFRRMSPWLTYTYPLVDVYATVSFSWLLFARKGRRAIGMGIGMGGL